MLHGKGTDFKLHMTKSMLFLTLQVCSVFYLATNTNGTLRGLFYHILSVIYPSIFFYVCFVEISERFAKTFQFLKFFMAAILCIGKLRRYFGSFCSVNHFSDSKAGLMKRVHPAWLRMTLAAQE